jgi:hypothetical protein
MPRFLSAIALLLVIIVLRPAGTADAVNPSLDGSEWEYDDVLFQWATSRFAKAGLDLPTVSVAFHDAMEACDGHPGLYRDRPSPRIDICGFANGSTGAKRTMLHELAHAWAHENLTEDDIDRFLAIRRLDTWAGPDAPWELRGSEHAAEIVSWALFDRELDLVAIPNAGMEAVEASYRLLTGRSLPDR